MAKQKKAGTPAASKKAKESEATLRRAASIVGQVLVHFGAGYAVEWQKSGATGQFPQIFHHPTALATFHGNLLESVLRELALPASDLHNWDTDPPGRDAVCHAAFQHGTLAFHAKPAQPLKYDVIESTLRVVQAHVCPPGSGGGPVCRF